MASLIDRTADAWIGRNAVPAPVLPPPGRAPAIVVTGGSEGIGFALAGAFRTYGVTVILVARSADRLAAAAEALARPDGPAILTVPLDVTAPDAPERLTDAVAATGHYIEILINNAGIGLGGPFAEMPAADIDCLVGLNVAASTRLLRHVLPDMLARASGGVVTLASLGGFTPGPWQAAYYASKAYLLSLSEAVAAENAGLGVRICVVAPGPVDTDFHKRMNADNALYRWVMPQLSPERTARSALFGYRLGRRVIVPGLMNTGASLLMRIVPHTLLIRVVGWLLRQR